MRSHGAIHKHVTVTKGWEKIQTKVKASVNIAMYENRNGNET